MLESDYLSSDSPAAMLAYLRGDVGPYAGIFPVPQLRSWVEACMAMADPHRQRRLVTPDELPLAVHGWTIPGQYADVLPLAMRAHLLRDVVPFRPVTLPCPDCGSPLVRSNLHQNRMRCEKCKAYPPMPIAIPWITSTVRALAAAALEGTCERCGGEKCVVSSAGYRVVSCPDCIGSGRVPVLDPDTLAILADALEMAGCTDADMLEHLRGTAAVHVRGCWAIQLLGGSSNG